MFSSLLNLAFKDIKMEATNSKLIPPEHLGIKSAWSKTEATDIHNSVMSIKNARHPTFS